MKDFQKHLIDSGYNSGTIFQYLKLVEIFLIWAVKREKSIEEFNYHDMVMFIDDTMRSIYYSNNLNRTINRIMISITAYYDFLILRNNNLYNPAKSMRVKDPHRTLVHNLLSRSELNTLYESYEVRDEREIRNKVILGFLVFQALSVSELHRLSISDIRLRSGTMMVRGDNSGKWRKGSTNRVLNLEALQIIDLIDYIDNIRPKILVNGFRKFPGRKPNEENVVFRTDQVLLSIFGSPNLKNSLHHMFNNLRKVNPRLRSSIHIRQSVIACWVDKHNLRQAQYMAGHRYVSSTEYYKQVNINDLKRQVLECHPLG
ncbi:MAG: tyrosine-type recombinase/integrase [Bacteroidales bacterium]|jgi:integrase/recombinase XerD|nr:tyrosine-type recombinase/integrase [Bacteroidales bacterium]